MLKPLIAASMVSLGLLAACSSSDDAGTAPSVDNPDGGSTTVDGGPVTPAQACTTIHKALAAKPADWFHVFKDEADALATLTNVYKTKTWRPAGSDAQKKGQAATSRVFDAYKKLYPEAVEGMTTAPVVVIEENTDTNPQPNAYAFTGQQITFGAGPKAAFVFVYTSKYIDGSTDDELAVVAAHELGHLLLRNGLDEYFKTTYYAVTTPDDVKKRIYGEYETNDPAVETAATKITSAGDRAGQAAVVELNGFPTSFGSDSGDGIQNARYFRYLRYLHNDLGVTGDKAADCTKATNKINQVLALLNAHLGADDPDHVSVGSDAAQLDQLTKDYWTAEASCLSVLSPMPTYRGAVAYAKKHHEDIANYPDKIAAIGSDQAKLDVYLQLSQNEKDADTAQPTQNIALKIQGLGIKAHEALRALFGGPTYETLRAFTPEDEADEAAIRIAKILNIPAQVRLEKLLTTMPADYGTACKSKLTAGTPPGYGGIVDPHHGVCWRGYHALQLEAALKTCPASWPQ